jgi:hypothetical protein
MNLLQALLKNESGGRNIPNVHQGTSSGQAQGYFQITTGTWDEFGGRKYAPNPLQASYEQQAEIASKIPLKRWDESTVALMRGTGRPIDTNKTLGENLAMSGESFGTAPNEPYSVRHVGGAGGSGQGEFASTDPSYSRRHVGGAGSSAPAEFAPNDPTTAAILAGAVNEPINDLAANLNNPYGGLGAALAKGLAKGGGDGDTYQGSAMPIPTVDYASAIPSGRRGLEVDLAPLGDLFKVEKVGQPMRPTSRFV